MKYKSSSYCPNCHFPLPYKGKFCAHCGQKTESSLLTVRSLFKQLWYRVLHLESRSLRYMLLLFIPGFVTKEFFSGRQKRFPQPIRFFFIVAFLFLFTLNHLASPRSFQAKQTDKGLVFNNKAAPKQANYDFFELGRRHAEFEIMRQEIDSLPEEYRTPLARKSIDSLLRRTYGPAIEQFEEIMSQAPDSTVANADSIDLNLGFKGFRLATTDAFRLDADGIIAKYEIHNWVDKNFVRQGLKTLKDPGALMQAYLGSLAWTLLGLIALMSAVLKLLYLRQKHFYVEHFILLLNEHSSMFLLLMAAMGINAIYPLGQLWIPLILWLLISPVLALKNYYGQGWGLTLLKSTVFFIVYLIGFSLLFTIGMLVVFIIF